MNRALQVEFTVEIECTITKTGAVTLTVFLLLVGLARCGDYRDLPLTIRKAGVAWYQTPKIYNYS
jgi:hypothetical protein